MLLSNFQKIQDIDKKINELHQERTKLFDNPDTKTKELQLISTSQLSLSSINDFSIERWASSQYAELLNQWQVHQIKIPKYKKIKSMLVSGYDLMMQVSIIKPELYGRMKLILIPPSKELKNFINPKSKSNIYKTSNEFSQAKFKKPKIYKKWRIFIVYSEPEGMYIGNPEQMLGDKRYIIADYDTYSLGIEEYTALVVQENSLIDKSSWTVLYRDCTSKHSLVPSVKNIGENYELSAENSNSIFGDIRFRPAIEIKE